MPGAVMFCSECGARFPVDEMIQFGDSRVCANCKDTFAQKLREGVTSSEVRHYGGFWIRVLAKILDGIIGWIVSILLNLIVYQTLLFGGAGRFGPVFFLQLLFGISYDVFFTSQYGGTPGKLALGLRIITVEGARLSVGQAVGRYFAQLISGITIGIGYIMAGFDEEKRTLHDRICNTRVVKI